MKQTTGKELFFDRDLSWLSFNERVLMEAENKNVPLLERINFLSIYSSNLDEFYRVRMPAINALDKLYKKEKVNKSLFETPSDIAARSGSVIHEQQQRFGSTLRGILPELEALNICLLYGKPVPEQISNEVSHYFFTDVLGFLQPIDIIENKQGFFPGNNKLYMLITGEGEYGAEKMIVVNVPSEYLPRFFTITKENKQYILFLEDIIRQHLHVIPGIKPAKNYTFKITRDAELDLKDHYDEDLAEMIEKQISKRDAGLATRCLYEPGISPETLSSFITALSLPPSAMMQGGRYHNLKELSALPINLPALRYAKQVATRNPVLNNQSLFEKISKADVLLHTPYHSYDAVLQFFNEAAIAVEVKHIYVTMYRVASDSRILNALLTAAHNGKKVTVIVELKARFDEANNIKWSKKLKDAGVRVIYTPNQLKVHAKVAFVQRSGEMQNQDLGLFATGNLNETTARFYTDHILMTSNQDLLKELKTLFDSFDQKSKPLSKYQFNHLLISQNNLQERFLQMIEREIEHARNGQPARIILKMNNLEERILISKLYEASEAGVKISLLVRSICCLVPGVKGSSGNITVTRLVDRYLEHGRVFIFHNNGKNELFLGSADWMNRNIYKRIEVCFPVYDVILKNRILELVSLQLSDNTKAVLIDSSLGNIPVENHNEKINAQSSIYNLVKSWK